MIPIGPVVDRRRAELMLRCSLRALDNPFAILSTSLCLQPCHMPFGLFHLFQEITVPVRVALWCAGGLFVWTVLPPLVYLFIALGKQDTSWVFSAESVAPNKCAARPEMPRFIALERSTHDVCAPAVSS